MSDPSNDATSAPTVTILYATETGNAQDAADYIARQLRRISLPSRVLSVSEITLPDLLSSPVLLLVISTTGAGSEPRAFTPLWRDLLRRDLPDDVFEDVYFGVFGLGDSAYERFCWPAKKVERRLVGLGAREVVERGEGDEGGVGGIEKALIPWTENLLNVLLELCPLPPGVSVIPDSVLPPARVSLLPSSFSSSSSIPPSSSYSNTDADTSYHLGTLKSNTRITAPEWFQDVRHFEFEFDHDVHYAPGDLALVHPLASPSDVAAFLTTMGWSDEEADEPLCVHWVMRDQSLPLPFPLPDPHSLHTTSIDTEADAPILHTTLREIFTKYLDFNAVPRRGFFVWLRLLLGDWERRDREREGGGERIEGSNEVEDRQREREEIEREREKLDEFLDPEFGAADLDTYTHRARRTIHEVFTEFRAAARVLTRGKEKERDYIFEVFPAMRPREFSLAGCVETHPRAIQLCIAIVRYKSLTLKVPRKGVCTSYLAGLMPGDTLPIKLVPGLLRLPPSTPTQVPIICIGPGTGIAPMRAVLEARMCMSDTNQNPHPDTDPNLNPTPMNTLYFGCRAVNKDEHYASEWRAHASAGRMVYRVGYSREGGISRDSEKGNEEKGKKERKEKTYVQDLLLEDAAQVWDIVGRRKGWVYVSGSSNKMPLAVRHAIAYAVRTFGGPDYEGDEGDDKGMKYVEQMEREGRYFEECWS